MASDLLGGVLGALGQALAGDSGSLVGGLRDGLDIGAEAGTEAGIGGDAGIVFVPLALTAGVLGYAIGTLDNLGGALDGVPLIGDVLGSVLHAGSGALDAAAQDVVAVVQHALDAVGGSVDFGIVGQLLNGDNGGLAGGVAHALDAGLDYGTDLGGTGVTGLVGAAAAAVVAFAGASLENLAGIDLGGEMPPGQGDYLL